MLPCSDRITRKKWMADMNLKDIALLFITGVVLATVVLFMNARAIRLFKEDHMIDACRTYNEKIPVYIGYCDDKVCMASVFNRDNYTVVYRKPIENETVGCKE